MYDCQRQFACAARNYINTFPNYICNKVSIVKRETEYFVTVFAWPSFRQSSAIRDVSEFLTDT